MKKKHKAYRHITAENISISIFFLMIRRPPRSTLDRSSAAPDVYKRQIPKHSFVDHPLQSISKQCLGTGNIPVNKSESVDFYWE